MITTDTNDLGIEIMKFLYRFKDDNKFYALEESELAASDKERHLSIYSLRDNAMIATDREVYHGDIDATEEVVYVNEIKAKILPKGIATVESLSLKN